MGRYRAMSIMQMTSGIPDDAVVNTWHFGHPTLPDLGAVAACWEDFMDAIKSMFSDVVDNGPHLIKFYDLAEPEPRVPMDELPWSFSSTLSGPTLPAEVAICLSYRGSFESGEPRARRRGRMFLGPVDGSTLTASGHIEGSTLGTLQTQFPAFVAALEESDAEFSVYSRSDDVLYPVVAGWIDNAYDTIRSRGPEATARYTFSTT